MFFSDGAIVGKRHSGLFKAFEFRGNPVRVGTERNCRKYMGNLGRLKKIYVDRSSGV